VRFLIIVMYVLDMLLRKATYLLTYLRTSLQIGGFLIKSLCYVMVTVKAPLWRLKLNLCYFAQLAKEIDRLTD